MFTSILTTVCSGDICTRGVKKRYFEIRVKGNSFHIHNLTRGHCMENYFSIWLSSANRKLVAKVATKNSQNSQLAELRQTSLPKLVGLRNLIGKMVSQAPFRSSSQNWSTGSTWAESKSASLNLLASNMVVT